MIAAERRKRQWHREYSKAWNLVFDEQKVQ